jgi:hypothetical protein
VTEPRAEPRHFDRVPLQGKVNEWLSKGFSIHENPFRKWFATDRREHKPPMPVPQTVTSMTLPVAGMAITAGDVNFGQLAPYFPFGNVNVDRSAFYYEPTALRRYGCFIVDSPIVTDVEMSLWTCGTFTIWKDWQELADFTPFTRNLVKCLKITVSLTTHTNLFFFCHDDLAERDTDYYFRIALRPLVGSWSPDNAPSIVLPLPDDLDAFEVTNTEKILDELHTTSEVMRPDSIRLSRENFLGDESLEASKLILSYRYGGGEGLGEASSSRKTTYGSFNAAARKEYPLMPYTAGDPGLLRIIVWRDIGIIRLEKTIGVLVAGAEVITKKGSIATRAHDALSHLASSSSENAYAALARLAVGVGPADYREEESLARALSEAEARHDCADFSLVPVIHAYLEFGDRLSKKLKEKILTTLVGFRYWIDEPGDDVMWFFSENHALLFHTCELFAGTILPDEVFPNSGMTGREHRHKALGLLDAWFERFFAESITEWNSSAYIPVDVHGLSALYRLCSIPEITGKAKRALDILFRTLALYAFDGVVMGTFGRSYEKELRGNLAAGTTPLLWVGYGVGRLNTAGLGFVELCLSGYEPPPGLAEIAMLGASSISRTVCRPSTLSFRNTQGWQRHVDCCLYRTSGATLSSAVDFRPGKPGYQEHIVHAALSASAQCWINHPGETRPGGGGRPSYWAGNGILPKTAQYRDIAVAIWNGSNDSESAIVARWTHAYLPLMEFDEYVLSPNSVVARKGDAFLGIRAANGIELVARGETAGREIRSPSLTNAWLITVEGSDIFPDISSFSAYFDGLGFEFRCDYRVDVGANTGNSIGNPAVFIPNSKYGDFFFPWKGEAELSGKPIPKGSADPEGILEIW